jgi:small conductance mechanosensitive channel
METGDGLFYFVPNSELWNKPLKNHSRNPRRLMTIPIRIGTGADPGAARRVLLEMAAEDPRILQNPPPSVHVETYADNAAVLSFRAWAPTSVFWDAQRSMTEEGRRRLEVAGIELA